MLIFLYHDVNDMKLAAFYFVFPKLVHIETSIRISFGFGFAYGIVKKSMRFIRKNADNKLMESTVR